MLLTLAPPLLGHPTGTGAAGPSQAGQDVGVASAMSYGQPKDQCPPSLVAKRYPTNEVYEPLLGHQT